MKKAPCLKRPCRAHEHWWQWDGVDYAIWGVFTVWSGYLSLTDIELTTRHAVLNLLITQVLVIGILTGGDLMGHYVHEALYVHDHESAGSTNNSGESHPRILGDSPGGDVSDGD